MNNGEVVIVLRERQVIEGGVIWNDDGISMSEAALCVSFNHLKARLIEVNLQQKSTRRE